MSNFNIPGINSQYKTNEIIDKLMKVEKVPLERMENQVKKVEKDKSVWLTLNNKINDLSNSSSNLYGFENPFRERTVLSSNDKSVIATAKRGANLQTHSVKVLQVAKADKISSDPIDLNYKIPSGKYTFLVGDKKISFKFNENSIKNFVDAVNNKGKEILEAKVINLSQNEKILMLESKLTGEKNKIIFQDDSINLAKALGFISNQKSSSVDFDLKTENNINKYNVSIEKNEKILDPKERFSINISKEFEKKSELILEVKISIKDLQENISKSKKNFYLDSSGEVTFENITLLNNLSVIDLKNMDKEGENLFEDLSFLKINGTIDGGKLANREDEQVFRYKIDDLNGILHSLQFENKNTAKAYIIKGINIYDPRATGDFKIKNPVNLASDSIFEYEGIKIKRETNHIEDVIPDINLTLLSPSEELVNLDINPDKDKIKNSIIAFTYNYNKFLEETIVATSSNKSVIEELSYLSDTEKKSAEEKLGALAGDSTILQIKNRLQTILTNSYNYNIDNKITMLNQIGIGSNLGGWSGYSASKYRGYLEFDEAKLDEAILKNIDGIKNLFGFDSNNDLIPDDGLAYNITTFLKPFIQKGGIIAKKIESYDYNIADQKKRVENFGDKLKKTEQEYKRKFGNMESMIEQLNKNSSSIRSLNNKNEDN